MGYLVVLVGLGEWMVVLGCCGGRGALPVFLPVLGTSCRPCSAGITRHLCSPSPLRSSPPVALCGWVVAVTMVGGVLGLSFLC